MRPVEIKQVRKKLGLTQKQLAEVLGCKMQTVQAWEQGNRNPGETFEERLERLAKRADKLAAKLDTSKASE